MKILIEIPSDIKDYIDSIELNSSYVRELIRCGTPLNECDDCISREDVLGLHQMKMGAKEIYKAIYDLPTVYPKNDKLSDGYYKREYLRDLGKEIYHELCKEVHGKEDCPCTNQTTSCLAKFRVCDADRAIGRVIDRKIAELPSVYPKSDKPSDDCISRKEAIKLIDAERKELHWIDNAEDELLEARRIINTLPNVYPKKVDCNDCYWNESSVSAYPKNKCKSEDCIKREEVCKYVHEFGNNEYSSDEERELLELIVDGIRHLPSACPVDNGKDNNVTTKTGHWIYNNALFDSWTCSCCKCDSDKYTDYCPHCGAFMNEDVIEKQEGENT